MNLIYLKRNIYFPTLCGLLAVAGAGCVSQGKLSQTEHFAQYDGQGGATYYKLSVSGFGENGKVNYRSGWFDARAVDDLFGDIGQEQKLKDATAKRQQVAVKNLYDKYMTALEDENQKEKINLYRGNYEEALSSLSGTASLSEGPAGALDHVGEKFVIILANDPDQIIKNIQNRLKSGSINQSIGKLLNGRAMQDEQTGKLKLDLLDVRVSSLKRSLSQTRESIPEDANQEMLESILRSLLAELEVAL